MTPAEIRENLKRVRQRIEQACARAGRDAAEVKLVAVSKTKPIEAIRAAYQAGQRDFGENYAQDLAKKAAALSDLVQIRWHFVGALQRNKAKLVLPCAELIHSVTSEGLLQKLQTLAERQRKLQKVLVQLNLSGEASKSGMAASELEHFLPRFAQTPNLRCVGLMTIPEAEKDATRDFATLRGLRDVLAKKDYPELRELSMGMTADLETAIAQGATLVRVGTAIFGARKNP